VQGSNNYGVWNQIGAGINIHVDPPWWGTFWFRTASGALLLLAALAGYRYRLHQIYSQVALRIEERVGERTRIARELHDTLLQSVLSASMQLHLGVDELPEDSPLKTRFERVIQIMSKVIDESRNTLRGLRAAPNDGVELERAFSRVPEELNLQASAAFSILVSGKCRPLHPVIYDEAYRIAKEMLTNAFRHSRAKTIEMKLVYGPGQMHIAVKDDGCGIAPQVARSGRDGHWGLRGMQERAGKIGAVLHVSTGEGVGTEIELVIDGRKAFQPQPHHPDPSLLDRRDYGIKIGKILKRAGQRSK
jgi:signal transduction histidine kinase